MADVFLLLQHGGNITERSGWHLAGESLSLEGLHYFGPCPQELASPEWRGGVTHLSTQPVHAASPSAFCLAISNLGLFLFDW